MATNIAAYYEVRRLARNPGIFHEERVVTDPEPGSPPPWRETSGGPAWQPVGTLAVDVIQGSERVAGLVRPPRVMLQDLARVSVGRLELRKWERRWRYRWRPPKDEEISRVLAALTRASFWRAVIVWQEAGSSEFIRRYRGQLVPFLQRLDVISDTIRFRGARTPPPKGRTETALHFSILNDEAGAVYLSIAFGILARRLRTCAQCEEPFLTHLGRLRQRICDTCRGAARKRAPRATGLSVRLRPLYSLVRKRLDQRVRRGKLSRQDRAQYLAEMLQALRRVQAGEATASEWQKRWDTTQPRGRPRRGGTTHVA